MCARAGVCLYLHLCGVSQEYVHTRERVGGREGGRERVRPRERERAKDEEREKERERDEESRTSAISMR